MNFEQRFNHDAETLDEARHYLTNRSKQLAIDGFKLDSIIDLNNFGTIVGVKARFTKNYKVYNSIYILNQFRGAQFYLKFASNLKDPIVTLEDCNIEKYLISNSIPSIVAGKFCNNPSYKLIEQVYNNKKAKRSGLFYMDHIDEGLAILTKRNEIKKQGIRNTMEAFCLHPILQVESLNKIYGKSLESPSIAPYTRTLAQDYAKVANDYLSFKKINSIEEITLSKFPEVNEMLVADKIQNRKSFEKFKSAYKNKMELELYFNFWLKKLDVSEDEYQYFKNYLNP